MKPGHYQFLAQDRVIWGKPAAQAVVEEADRLGARRVFVVTGKTLARKTDVIERIRIALGDRFVGMFDETRAHTPRPSVIEGARAARAARPDLIVTVGGGTPVDTVKVMLICLAHDVTTVDQLDNWHVKVNPDGTRRIPDVKSPPCRQIVVGTTLSGAEYSNLGGCTDPKRRIKDAFTGREIGALSVILDPAVSVHTPDWLWLSTGVRAVDHAVEGLLSPDAHPFLDGLHLHALRLLGRSLRRNKETPGDLDARLQSMIAVWLASSGINRVNYGASHGIGHALGGAADVPHGYTSCVMLPAVLRYNLPATADRQRLVSDALGAPDRPAADCVQALVRDLGLPGTLRDVGLKREQFDAVANAAMHNIWVRTNPQPIAGPDDVKRILETVW
ncbi:MAG: iron-containing alcohol dehydrogenase [Alphaproteobacteria bacterium]|nr:iron-containing alcohol dehydrogenase [Alphaproteobacteria bacterium]